MGIFGRKKKKKTALMAARAELPKTKKIKVPGVKGAVEVPASLKGPEITANLIARGIILPTQKGAETSRAREPIIKGHDIIVKEMAGKMPISQTLTPAQKADKVMKLANIEKKDIEKYLNEWGAPRASHDEQVEIRERVSETMKQFKNSSLDGRANIIVDLQLKGDRKIAKTALQMIYIKLLEDAEKKE